MADSVNRAEPTMNTWPSAVAVAAVQRPVLG
jgi:hypothetical protein